MFHKTVFSGVVGQVLARGTCYLSLAKANLQTPVMRNQRFSYPLVQPNKVKYLDMGNCCLEMEDLEEITMVPATEGLLIREIHTVAEMVNQTEKHSIRNRDVSEADPHSHLTCS